MKVLLSHLSRYLIQDYLMKLGNIILLFSSVIGFITFLEVLRKTKKESLGFVDKLVLTGKQMPFILEQILPLLCVIACLWSIMLLARHSEMIIIKMTGLSQNSLCFLFGGVAFFIGMSFVLLVNPYGTKWIKEYYHWKSYRSEAITPVKVRTEYQDYSLYILADAMNPQEYTMKRCMVYFIKDKVTKKIMFAQKATYIAPHLSLQSPTEVELQKEKFMMKDYTKEFTLALPDLKKLLTVKTKTDHIYSLYTYPQEIESLEELSPLKAKLRTNFYQLLWMPVFCGLLSALAVAFVPNQIRGGQILKNSVMILLFSFLLFAVDIVFVSLGKNAILPPMMAVLLAKLINFTIIIWTILKKEYGTVA